jgi:CelD/BcsL family acetyltransferase involved in cellulose biosynthesis
VTPTLEADPDCARPAGFGELTAQPTVETGSPSRALRAEHRTFGAMDPDAWDSLAATNPWVTPFSSWAFQRAWWDGYGETAHEQTLAVTDESGRLVGIAPLMHRHAVEATDAETRTSIRHGSAPSLTPVAASAKAVYFGASYHADYATLLSAPDDLAGVADAVVGALAREATPDPGHPARWDVVDLRRLRAGDPVIDALASAVARREIAEGWTLNLEREDVCPVIRIPDGVDLDGFLATLGKKERHEMRRKVRRAEAAGQVELVESTDPLDDLEAFIDLHQRRWGADGLFPPTPGGDQSRSFMRRLFELFAARSGTPGHPSLHLCFLRVGGRSVAASLHFETADSLLYYNAGVDPEARALSPGVVLLERLVRRAIERGKARLDLLRGDEPYKYAWGAVDEPIQRLLIRRRTGG